MKVPMDNGEHGLEHLLLKTFPAFVKHVAKVKDKVDGSAGSKSPLKKKKQQWRLHLLAARAQEDEGR
jgi:hypothetical protein